MSEISDMDWAQYIKMEYAYNLRKDPAKAKKRTLTKFLHDTACKISQRGIYNIMKTYDKTGSIKDGRWK